MALSPRARALGWTTAMCRFLVYKGTDMLMADLLTRSAQSLIRQSYRAREREEPLHSRYGFAIWSSGDSPVRYGFATRSSRSLPTPYV